MQVLGREDVESYGFWLLSSRYNVPPKTHWCNMPSGITSLTTVNSNNKSNPYSAGIDFRRQKSIPAL